MSDTGILAEIARYIACAYFGGTVFSALDSPWWMLEVAGICCLIASFVLEVPRD